MSRIRIVDLETFKGRMGWESQKNRLGEYSVGAFALKNTKQDFYLYPLDDFDDKFYKNAKLGKNEKLFRYETETCRIGQFLPLIKVNVVSGLIYFLEDLYRDECIFDRISQKPIWISINKKAI